MVAYGLLFIGRCILVCTYPPNTIDIVVGLVPGLVALLLCVGASMGFKPLFFRIILVIFGLLFIGNAALTAWMHFAFKGNPYFSSIFPSALCSSIAQFIWGLGQILFAIMCKLEPVISPTTKEERLLKELQHQLESGSISQEEYNARRMDIISHL